ncbi:MAG: B12-binding domain-containing radical SAM protein [Elusimicrobiota bacterium]
MPRRNRVALVQAPVFSRVGPSNALALLKAYLRRDGIPVTIHDASLGVRRSLKAAGLAWNEFQVHDADEMYRAIAGAPAGCLEAALDREAAEIVAAAPDIVGFTVQFSTESCSLELARRVKTLAPKTAVVFGGAQCVRETKAFDFIRDPFVDAVCLGEGDRSFPEFVSAFEPGGAIPPVAGFLTKDGARVVDGGDPSEIEDLDALPFMDFSDFQMDVYMPEALYIVTSRGCVRHCSFCTSILGQKVYRRMSAERIVAEIRHQLGHYPEKCFIRFEDSLINGDVSLLARLSELLVPFRMEMALKRSRFDFGWGALAIIHRTMSPALLTKMRHGGCQILAYGLESGSQRVVDRMRKNFRIEDAEIVMRDTKAAGIAVKLFMMVGHPGETDEDFEETLNFLRRNDDNISVVTVSFCEILKGSHLAAHLEEYGISPDMPDPRRWRSLDGANTIEVREARYRTLLDLIRRLGFGTEDKVCAQVFSKDLGATQWDRLAASAATPAP